MQNYPKLSDAELWDFVARGDHRAFDEIYRRYGQKVYCEANRVLCDSEVSSDLVQEVFIGLWTKRNTKVTCLSSYLHGMTRNQVFKHLRRGRIARSYLACLSRIASENFTEQMVNLSQLQDKYSTGVTELPERCQEIFRLSRDEHLSNQEIAARLCISPKTVENQITKALKHLKIVLRIIAVPVLLLFV